MSLSHPRIDLWDLTKKERINKYYGHQQSNHII